MAVFQKKRHIDFPMEILVIQFQAWQFDENPAFKIYFSKRSKYTSDKSLAFLVVACPDYHFVQLGLVCIGFLKA